MFFKKSKEKKLKSVLAMLLAHSLQDGEATKEEGEEIGRIAQKYAIKLGIKDIESAMREVLNADGDQLGSYQLDISKWPADEKIELLNEMVSLSAADGDLSMPELFAIGMWAEIWGGLNAGEIMNAILTHPKVLEDFGDLEPEYIRYLERVGEIGVNETKEEYNAKRLQGSDNDKTDNVKAKFCSECGKEVSIEAKFCTHCGHKQ